MKEEGSGAERDLGLVKSIQGPVVEQEQNEGEGDEHGFGHEAAGEEQQRQQVEA